MQDKIKETINGLGFVIDCVEGMIPDAVYDMENIGYMHTVLQTARNLLERKTTQINTEIHNILELYLNGEIGSSDAMLEIQISYWGPDQISDDKEI